MVAELHSGGATVAQHPRCDAVALQGEALSQSELRRAILVVGADDGQCIVGLESAHYRVTYFKASRHFRGDCWKQFGRADAAGDQSGDPPQSRLLCGQRPEVRRFPQSAADFTRSSLVSFPSRLTFSGPRLAALTSTCFGANAQQHCAAPALLSQPAAIGPLLGR